jgi:hypothetical protein
MAGEPQARSVWHAGRAGAVIFSKDAKSTKM